MPDDPGPTSARTLGPDDYLRILDAPMRAFIRRSEEVSVPDPGTTGVAAQRSAYGRMCEAFHTPRPEEIAVTDQSISGVPTRRYECGASAVTVVYYHGGGFVLGGLDSHDGVCAELCDGSGLRVVSADYRLTPEHVHPAHYDDAMAVARALASDGPLILMGDSAGATLAASVAHGLRGQADLRGLLLIYPYVGGAMEGGSYVTHANAPMLTTAEARAYSQLRFGGPVPRGDVTALALADSDFSGLPPVVIFSAECDPLADDGRTYAEAVRRAGGNAVWHLEPGLVHGYLRARHTVPRAGESFARMIGTLRSMAQLPAA